jgi:hypothetical protein
LGKLRVFECILRKTAEERVEDGRGRNYLING